jgi:NAD+ kinase
MMKHFGIFINPHYSSQKAIFELLEKLHRESGVDFYDVSEQTENVPDFIHSYSETMKKKLDCILVFGGDGTMLRAVNYSLKTNAPLLGINLGKLGFLSESSLSNLEKSIGDLKKNKFKIQSRLLLKVTLKRGKKFIFTGTALNDAVIYKGKAPKLIDIKCFNNRRFVVETRCDGIIAATPTGSTAYSLSAGGPILSPVMEALIVAPLNPHVLTVRPMVFSAKDSLHFQVMQTNTESILQLDGQNSHELLDNDEIFVTASNQKVQFVKLSNKTFYQILRNKFHMGKK